MTPTTSLHLALMGLITACGATKPRPTATKPVEVARSPLVIHGDAKLIDLTVDPTTSLVLAGATSELGIRVRVTAKTSPDGRRPPIDLALVLDSSGSMENGPIEAVKASAAALVSKLAAGDRISLTSFHSRGEVLIPDTAIDDASKQRVLAAIGTIKAQGTTDLAAGLTMGYQQVSAHQFPNGIKRIVLLSDGVPNASVALPNLVAAIRQAGQSITAFGLGDDYDTNLMTQLARDTGGNFHYIEKPTEVASVFDEEITKLTTVAGRNLQLVLAAGPGVQITPMQGMNVAGDGKIYMTLGDLAAGETRDLMIPIKVTARGEGSTAELVDATLTFDDVVGQSGTQHREGFASVKTSKDPSALKDAIKIDLEVARIRAIAASAILDAMQLARGGQIDPARQRIAHALMLVRAAVTRLKDPDLDKLAKELESVSNQLTKLAPAQIVRPVSIAPTKVKASVAGGDAVDVPMSAPTYSVGSSAGVPATAAPDIERALRRSEQRAQDTATGRAHP